MDRNRQCRAGLCLGAIVALSTTHASAEESSPAVGWKAEAELGFIQTSGNRDSTAINAKLAGTHEAPKWRNKFDAEYLESSDAFGVSTRRSVAQAATNYKLDAAKYLFGNLRAEQDRFAAYEYRISETLGYGHRFAREPQTLELEIGIGGSHTEFVGGDHEDEGIVRIAGRYMWAFSETGEFSNRAFSESGESNTHSESETALKLKVSNRLAMKIAYKLFHNTEPPPGVRGTDSVAAVTLVYGF